MLKWLMKLWKRNKDDVERLAAAELIEAALIPLSADEAIAVLEAALATVRNQKGGGK